MNRSEDQLELYELIRNLMKSLRFFQSESIFCEGITFTQYTILDFVSKNKNASMSRLGAFLDVEKSTTTRLIKSLLDNQYLVQVKSKDDLRTTLLQLTQPGSEIKNKVEKCMLEFLGEMTQKLKKDEMKATIKAVNHFSTLLSGCCRGGCSV